MALARSSMAGPPSSSIYGASSAASRSSATLITPQVLALSDAPVPQVDSHAFDFLNMEMIRILLDSAETAHSKMEERRRLILRSLEETYGYKEVEVPVASTSGTSIKNEQERQDDALRIRLESIGYKVGCCLAERLARERPPLAKQQAQPSTASASGLNPQPPLEPLEVVKFVCKDVWTALFDKPVDNLRTNHRGVFVIQDNALKPLLRISVPDPQNPVQQAAALRKGRQLTGLYTGIVKGSLATLGLHAVVSAEHNGGTQCIFHIKSTIKVPAT